MANVSQLQPAVIPQVQRSSTEPAEKDADFLALRLLNKRARVRLSPEPIDLSPIPGKACLFAVANSKGWFTAITRDASGGSALILSPLSDLRSAFASASADDDRPYQPQRRLQLGGAIPIIVVFACNDTRIMLGLADGSIIVYASDHLLSSGDGPVNPLHAFPASSSTTLLSVHPNPGDIPELVAVLRDCSNSPGSLTVELLDVQKLMPSGGWMAGKSPSTTPTSLSWSPKGKQLALGLQSGDIVTYSPTATATPKFSIPHPPSASNMSVISIQWLSTSSFHAIYAPPGQLVPDVEQLHFHVSLDAKSNSAQDVKFNSPYLPFPGLRPPGAFVVCLRGWDPSKVLLFIGDSTSSDIGAISSVVDGAGESWHNLSLEETSTPCLPLDKDQNDTIMLGLEVDLTNDSSYRHTTASGEALDLPAPPIMLAYASDGTILGWHLLNVSGKSYPGMVTASDAATSAPSMMSVPSSIVRELSSDMHTTPSASPTTTVAASTSAFGQPSTSPFGPSAFGAQSSAFGQPSAFGQSAFSQQPTSVFGQAPSFGQSSFGQPTTTTTPSPFGQPVTSAFSSAVPSSGGFGAFSSAGPATFGQSAFGAFGGATQSAAPASTPTPPQETSPEDSMAADDGPSLGGFGLGGANSEDADNKPSIFGNTSAQASSSQQSSEGGMIKPASGFGAFANIDQKSPFANPSSAFPATTQPTSVFGQSAFQTKPEGGFGKSTFGTQPSSAFGQSGFSQTTPAFGQSSFGQPAFGQSAFGQAQSGTSTFGKPSFGTAPTTAPATTSSATGGGAFSAFASNTQSAFGALAAKDGGSTKPAWATGDSLKPDQPKSVSGGATTTSVFTKPTESPAVKTPSPFAPRDTDMSTPANATPSAFSSPSPFAATSPFAARESAVRGDDSRSPSPAPTQQEPAAPSTPFKSSSPGPTTGAFSNLKTTPSNFFKPASGFFGEMPKDSPFFAPKPPEATPVSAFALAAAPVTPTSTPPKPSTTAPTFGASSMPGGTLKSPFTASTSPAPVQSAFAPATGAFSAFSNTGGFGSFSSGGNKSFSDLLRSAGEEGKDSAKGKASLFASTVDGAKGSSQTPVSTTPVSTPTKEPPKAQPGTPSTPLPAATADEKETETSLAKSSESESASGKGKAKETFSAHEPSIESISSSTSSSFVNVSAEEAGEAEDGEVVEEDTIVEGGEEDGSDGFLTDLTSDSESEDHSEQSSGAEEEEEKEKDREPTETPLLATPSKTTRSPSTTPKAELPKITVSTSPSPSPQPASPSGSVPRVSPVRDFSTTPPGSPVKEGTHATSPVQAPVPKPSPSANSPFSLAPRPNNRPVRSSPLASTPLVLEGEGAVTPPPVSKSAPPATTPQPAAPKAPFGQWAPPVTVKLEAESSLSSRPKTPPLLSTFSGPGSKPASTSAPPATTPGPSLAPFTLPSALPPFTPGSGTSSLFGTPIKAAEATPTPAKSAPVPFTTPASLFGPKISGETTPSASTVAPSVSPSPFSMPSPSLSSPSPAPVSALAPAPAPPTPEQGMQAECAYLFQTLARELESLKQLATAASAKSADIKKTSGVTHTKADLGDVRKWLFGDIKEYGRILADVQVDVTELKLQRITLRKSLREIDSNMLKAETRKEEIKRFNKAKTDAEFAKMLKVRTLGPEYLETQQQLRRDIRAMRDRVQKLEDHLQASKKKISELRTGKPSLRAPSLDTVSRTFRNIDIAIDQQKQDVSKLRFRMSKLDISSEGASARDKLIGSTSKRPLNVTPNVAVTTAAALNAERSAQRLKRALLAARTQPLLNTKAAAAAAPPPTSFQTPQKAMPVKTEAITPNAPFSLPTTPMMSFPTSIPAWTPPTPTPSEFGDSASHGISPSRNRGGHRHPHPIVSKKIASPGSATQGSPFEWKPVEPMKPISSLPFAIRPAGSN